MIISIIGAGNVGGALARRLLQSGHEVLVGARFPLSSKSLQLATHIGEDRFCQVNQAVAQSQVVIITTPPEAVVPLITELGDLSNKVVIDTTNAIRNKPEPYLTAFEAIKKMTGHQSVVKCFNTTGYENMLNPVYADGGIDVFVSGDDKQACAVAQQLAKDMGFANCYYFGGDDKVALQEQFALCWINLAIMQNHGRDIAIKLTRR